MTIDKNILSILENLIPFPTFILDDEGRIIDFNQKGKKFLPDATFNTSIFEILDKEFAVVLERLLYEAKNFDKGVKENVLADKSENPDEYEISVTPFKDEIQKTFIVTIRLVTDSRQNKELQRFTIVTEEIDKLIRDEELFEIIKSVKSAFPFTFIGKAKIQKQIDMLEGFFWIKDNSRRFILINQKFATLLGVKAKQLEGRFEKDVLPHFQNKLYSTIDNYIFETTNSVIIDGVSSSSPYGNHPYEIVEFPILDIDNNVVAIIGVSQRTKSKSSTETGLFDINFIKDLDLPYILTDKSGKIHSFNDSVRKFLYGTTEISNKYIFDIFSENELIAELKKFLENDKNNKVNVKIAKEVELLCFRNYSEKGQTSQILFVFHDLSKLDSQTAGIIKMYDAIMKISPQAMFIYDLENLKFLEVNDAAVKLYGYSKDEFLNMDLTDLYAPEDIQTLLETGNRKSQTNEFTGPWRHKKKDGSSIIVELSSSPLEYKGKSAYINIVKNVTDEIKNSKKIKLFKSAFDNSSDLIFVTDKDGFITYANESVIRSLGYSKSDLEKKPFLSLLNDENRAEFNKTVIHSDSKEPKKYKAEIKDSSGVFIETSMVATPIYEFTGELESIAIVGKIKQQAAVSQPEVSTKKKESKGIEPSFLSNVFHELLTPINVILGFIQEINESIDNPNDEQKEAIDIIKENQKLLLQIMDTAAEYSAFEDNKVQFKPKEITFVDLLEEIQTTTERTARSNNIELTYGKISSSLKLTTDKHHFTTLITQFIKYAMQISKENKLYLSAYTYDSGQCVVSVKDKREGITSHLLNGLRDIFIKDEDSLRKSLGVSRITTKLFRKLIDSLDARNEVISRDDKPIEFGLVFPEVLEIETQKETEDEFAIAAKEREEHLRKTLEEEMKARKPEPVEVEEKVEEKKDSKEVNINVNVSSPTAEIKPEEQPPKKPEPIPEPPIEKPQETVRTEKKPLNLASLKCLYVEDQVDSQILFKVQMKELQEIEFATSFEEALPKIKGKEFDFIVMDINLEGEYNGLDALRVIQKLPAYHDKPVIAVTAYVLPGDREKFIAAGFSDFISKPVLKDKLVDALEKIF